MHLLVLSAFRRGSCSPSTTRTYTSLNAPSGAQCFPTGTMDMIEEHGLEGLNAPSGAQCFPTLDGWEREVLGSFRLNAPSGAQCFPTGCLTGWGARDPESQCTFWCSVLSDRRSGCGMRWRILGSQCTFWCSVLSDGTTENIAFADRKSQCTFWCSVLSDLCSGSVRVRLISCLNAPSGAQCFPTGLFVHN